ncbi:N-alpha-acetyltransferase 16, NatA auxiliary subunit [Rhizoctonia solani]|uniref:N-alpha-acetyltransferase 16, NatA auxiliary subunit n=1 Tax=Rhizoctonia solani TaxID=456999 RepID=A0A0K6FYZ0_9AGAM|nr:N-alpha-acetyltransferase 16, NatA auxiliary subunit [Rhizoctonia solani]
MPPRIAPKQAVLASKEQSLFKELLSLYETRQYKKAIKTADTILKKAPTHGETICMKGLVFTNMPGKRDEGVELVRKGLALGLESHICWHVYGLVLKQEKNYAQALGAYNRALKYDVDNMNILRDAAQLQMQLRQFDQLVQTRHTLLALRPTMRQSWVALAVAHQMNRDLEKADKILVNYKSVLKNVPDYDCEHSELLLYHLRIMEGLGKHEEVLAALDVYSKQREILDRTAIVEFRARNLGKANRKAEAAHEWTTLIEQNYESYAYYRGFLATQDIDLDNLTDESRSAALASFKKLVTQYPGATAPRRLSLDVALGDEFRSLVEPYLWTGLQRGIPSLFVDIKSLYKNDEKRAVVEEVVEGFLAKLKPEEVAKESQSTTNGETKPEAPTTYLWTLYYLGQHYSYCGDQEKALSFLDTAIAHTPTLPELYTTRARALKRAGDYVSASFAAEAGRLLDGQDRWLNGKSAKYAMRAGRVEDAHNLLGLFTRKDALSPSFDLTEMQSLVYLIQEGDAHRRAGRLPMALKRYNAVAQIFDDIWDDQYDFHSYCIRRFTLNIYTDTINWEDHIREHGAYRKAAVEAAKIYIQLHDDPSLVAACTPKLTAEEKKAKAKAVKAASKEPKKANHAKEEEAPPPKDDDPDGLKLLSQDKPIEQALKLLRPLEALQVQDIDVWLTIYDVAMRRKKYLQALKALNVVKKLSSDHHELHWRIIDFRLQTFGEAALDASIKATIDQSLNELIPLQQSPEAFNAQYLQRVSTPAAKLGSALAVLKIHGLEAGQAEAEELIFQVLHPEAKTSILDLLEGARLLQDVVKSKRVDEFKAKGQKLHPLSTALRTEQELESLRLELARAGKKIEEAKPVVDAEE